MPGINTIFYICLVLIPSLMHVKTFMHFAKIWGEQIDRRFAKIWGEKIDAKNASMLIISINDPLITHFAEN